MPSSQRPQGAPDDWPDPRKSRRLQVLLAGPDPKRLHDLQRNLAWQGYEVYFACDRRSAERFLRRMPITLFLTDLSLDEEDGREGAELIRTVKEHRPATKSILISGAPTSSLAAEAASCGAAAYLTKPIDFEELRLTMLRVLKTL